MAFKAPASPRSEKDWRRFWSLPAGHDDFTEADWTAWHEWRCRVLEKRYKLGIHYDKRRADLHLRFFGSLKHTKGSQFAGKYFEPLAWQDHQVLRPLFGYVTADGLRLFRKVFIIVPKKNGKSELAAGIVLDQLFIEGEPGAEVFGLAKDREQASGIFQVVAGMIRKDPELRDMCRVLDTTRRVIVPDPTGTDSYYAVASADVANKEGPSIQALVADEIHVIPRLLYEVMTDGSGEARLQPIEFGITTAGQDINSVCYELLQMARGVRDGVVSLPHFLPVIYEPDEGDDWEDEATWWKVNPSMGVTIQPDRFRAAYEEAKAMPSKMASFQRRRLNIWVSSESRYLPMDKWDACGVAGGIAELAARRDAMLRELKGEECIGWLDLSTVTDITTFGLLFPRPDGRVAVIPWFFLPSDNIDARQEQDRVLYREWARYGFVELTPGNKTDQSFVKRRINEIRDAGFRFREIAYDDWNAGKIETELEEDGFTMFPVSQSISGMNAGTKELLGHTLAITLDHGGNPVLRWMASNLVVKQDQNERVQPHKGKSTGRIDGLVGIVMALDRLIRTEVQHRSCYEDDDCVI